MEKELLTSLIAAGSAILGVAASQLGGIVRSVFDKNSERTVLLRSKLEELADNVHKTTEWSNCLLNALPGKAEAHSTAPECPGLFQVSSEARRVYVLSLLYFPPFRLEARSLLEASYDFYRSMSGAQVDQALMSDAASRFRLAKTALDDLITIEAEKIT